MKIADNYSKFGNKMYHELPDDFPDKLMNEDWAQRIHSQSLKRLNERGGMGMNEIIGNIKKLSHNEIMELDSISSNAILSRLQLLNCNNRNFLYSLLEYDLTYTFLYYHIRIQLL